MSEEAYQTFKKEYFVCPRDPHKGGYYTKDSFNSCKAPLSSNLLGATIGTHIEYSKTGQICKVQSIMVFGNKPSYYKAIKEHH